MSAQSSAALWNRAFILCLFNNLFLFVYYFALLAVLPIYIMNDLGGTVKEAGLALTLFLVSSIAIRPFSGLIVEKLGKKLSFVVLSCALCCLPFAISGLTACGACCWCVFTWHLVQYFNHGGGAGGQ